MEECCVFCSFHGVIAVTVLIAVMSLRLPWSLIHWSCREILHLDLVDIWTWIWRHRWRYDFHVFTFIVGQLFLFPVEYCDKWLQAVWLLTRYTFWSTRLSHILAKILYAKHLAMPNYHWKCSDHYFGGYWGKLKGILGFVPIAAPETRLLSY